MQSLRNKQYLDYQIPIIDEHQFNGNFHTIPVDKKHALYCEPLVKVDSLNIAYECYHAKTDCNNPPYLQALLGSRQDMWLRQSALEKLHQANEYLLPFGAELFVLDGYRSIRCQQSLWEFYLSHAMQKKPHASEQEWRNDALQFVADPTPFDPDDSETWSAHTNGGAVDITLRDLITGALLDMGSLFEQINPISYNDYFERQLAAGNIRADHPCLYNRRLLHWAMSTAGFLNDPFVYWHYDWGNQLYIKNRQRLFNDTIQAAWYGYIASPHSH